MAHRTEYQICKKCGKIYAERNIDGPEFGFEVEMMRMSNRTTMCAKCGGDVVWQSQEDMTKTATGCLPILLAAVLFPLVFGIAWHLMS